jgi:GH25 family lysozyme M1 (1,4-beta-N-acetylmuramidase)
MLGMQDISNWQGPKAPENVAKNEVLAIKATEGAGFQDPDFENNWKFADDNEKARLAYHFFHPSIPALVQARYFLDYVDRFGIETGDLFALDLEVTDGRLPNEVSAGARQFVEEVNHETGASCWVYTFRFFSENPDGTETGNTAGLENSPLWIADPSAPPGRPRVPKPWNLWTAHQFGVFRGIDADIVNVGDVAQLAKLGSFRASPEPPASVVTLRLEDTAGIFTTEEFHETTQLLQLRGRTITAGDAKLFFK